MRSGRMRGWWVLVLITCGYGTLSCVGESPCYYTATCPPPEAGSEEEEVLVSETDESDSDSSDPDPEPNGPGPNGPGPNDPEPNDPEPNDPEPNDPDGTATEPGTDDETDTLSTVPTNLPVFPVLPVGVFPLPDAGVDEGAEGGTSDAVDEREGGELGDEEIEDACAENNGGCDPLAECTNTGEGPECGACPSGYVGDGTTGCAPTLLGLGLSHGTLSPEIEPGLDVYDVTVPVFIQNLTLTPSVPAGASVSIRGAAIASGASWTSPPLSLGESEIRLQVEQEGRSSVEYTLNVRRGAALTEYIKASNTNALDVFGSSIAVSGDGSTLVVGAYQESSNALGVGGDESNNDALRAGAAYVFTRTGSGWVQQAYIKASNADREGWFGVSVALSENGSTLAVGATGEGSSGAVYVFVRSGSGWSQQAHIKASNADAGDAFGASVGLSGDGDTLAIGAHGEASNATTIGGAQDNNGASNAGAAYVFRRTTGSWSQQAYIKASNAEAWDRFGGSLALSHDGRTLAVGASDEDSSAVGIGGNQASNDASGSGAVYVFGWNGAGWSQQAYIKASNAEEFDRFGAALAIAADGNTLAVGAPNESSSAVGVGADQSNNGAANAGAVYVFVRSGVAWSQQAYVKAPNAAAYDYFGSSVTLSQAGSTLAVGAVYEDGASPGVGGDQTNNEASNSGAVYVFARNNGSWGHQSYVKAPNPGAGDEFGYSTALSGDGNTLAVGATGESSSATGVGGNQLSNEMNKSGAVYVLR